MILTIDVFTSESDWQDRAVCTLLDGDTLVLHDVKTGIVITIRASTLWRKPTVPVWRQLKRILKKAGIAALEPARW